MQVRVDVVERSEACLRAAVGGELDLATRDDLRIHLLPLVCGAPVVVLDLAEVQFVDATGLKVLAAAARQARQRGGQLVLARPPSMLVRMIDLLGLHDLLPLEQSN